MIITGNSLAGRIRGIVFAMLAAVLLFNGCGGNDDRPVTALKGLMDLRSWNFQVRGPVALNGEWEFYWKKLYTPDDFKASQPPVPDTLVNVPGIWNGNVINGESLEGRGFATYRLVIRLDNEGSTLGLKILDAATAYRLWVNGQLLATNGTVGDSPDAGRPQYLPMVVPIPGSHHKGDVEETFLEVVVQVSNYHHTKGGLWESLRIGLYADLVDSRELNIAFAFFLAGVIIIMGLYHLGLYLLRRKEIATFFFALLALTMSIRSLIINDRLLVHWYPSISWEFLVSIEYITSFSTIAIIALFIGALYGNELKRKVVIVIASIGALYCFMFIAFKVEIFNQFRPAYDLYVLLGGGYIIYCLLVSTIRKRDGAVIALSGMSALYFTGINDVLYNAHLVNTTNLAPVGLFLYILSQSYLLSRRFTGAMHSVEKLSGELSDLNKNLERKVDERTEELLAAFEEMEAMNEQLVGNQNVMMGELELARKIQRQLIPQAVPIGRSISSHYLPMEMVGGDFFDYILFRDSNLLGIFLSDVSGHGVPAALITSMMKSFILQAGSRKENPAELLAFLNEQLRAYAGGNFITAFYCIINSKTKSLMYSNAGHNPPILVENGILTCLDKLKSVPLCIMDNDDLEQRGKPFRNYDMKIIDGSRLFLYTDGLTDVQRHDDPLSYFGEEMLEDVIASSLDLPPSDFIYNLMKELRDYQKRDSFNDDICVICMDL